MDPISEWLWTSLLYLAFCAALVLLDKHISDTPKRLPRPLAPSRPRTTTHETDEN